MYQIVFTSEFIRDLKESTGAGSPRLEVPPTEQLSEPAPEVIKLPGARTRLAALADAVFCVAHRVLGAH